MGSNEVNSEDRRSCFIGVKLTELELRRVRRSIRNYRIKKQNFSESFRSLLLRTYRNSVKFDKRIRAAADLENRDLNKNSDALL